MDATAVRPPHQPDGIGSQAIGEVMPQYHLPGLARLFLVNLRRSPKSLAGQVDQQLRFLVAHAYEHVPVYRELWKEAGFYPRDFAGRRDLAKIPMLDKQMIVDAGFDACDQRLDPDSLEVMTTSGTSGCAIQMRRTVEELRMSRRSYLRSLFLVGARPWHPTVTVCSPWLAARKGSFVSRFCKTHHIYPLDSLDQQIDLLQSFQPGGMVGQTGGLYLLARELLRRGMQHPLRFLAPTGSTLMPEMARAMRNAFAAEPRDLYGTIELGAISWQCRKGNYHIDADRVIPEVVDNDGNPVPLGQTGQVVCTSLYSYAMPFIRYRLLDIGALSTRTCNCGCRFPLMEQVQGRINDYLPTPKGDLVSPHFFFHLYDHAGSTPVKEWRIIQNSLDDLTYEYIPEEDFDPAALDKGMDLIRTRFGETTHVRAVPVENVPGCPKTGKRQCIVSKLRPEDFTYGKPWIRNETDDGERHHA